MNTGIIVSYQSLATYFYLSVVSRDVLSLGQIRVYPTICMVSEGEQESEPHSSIQRLHLLARISCLCYLKPRSSLGADASINSLLHDVRLAMMSKTTHNHSGTCILTKFVGFDPVTAHDEPVIGFVVDFDLHYYMLRTTGGTDN